MPTMIPIKKNDEVYVLRGKNRGKNKAIAGNLTATAVSK